jgi:hypothetical protein
MRPPPHRIRRNLKALEAVKAAAIIISLLIGCILLVWLVNPMLQEQAPEEDQTPKPSKSMWEQPTNSPTPTPSRPFSPRPPDP